MAMKKVNVNMSLVLCFLAILAVENAQCASPHLAPSPSVDCSNLILNMADCLSYVSNDSTTTKPEATCCSGLKTVLKADAECLCEAFKSSAQFGVVLNLTKAMALPSACGVSAPSISTCGLSAGVPGAAPAQSPSSSTTPMNLGAGGTPAPAPASSGSAMLSVSLASLVAGLALCF